MDAFRSLDRSPVVSSFAVLDHRVWHTGSYLRLTVVLRDGSELHTREYLDEYEKKYSFHWQTATGDLLVRWDNAQHHRELSTHPDHKHVDGGVEASFEVSLDDVLLWIEQQMA